MTVYVKALPVEQSRRKPVRLTKPARV
ncbi:MAG: hypothetical protein QOG28_3331, partial [Trebonia sp.]|nr:hypothetical protein [Trebonia sp.]